MVEAFRRRLAFDPAKVPPFARLVPLRLSPSYIIYIEDTTIKALNCQTGEVEFSGTDASTVIQQALDALVGIGGVVFIKEGLFEITAELGIPSDVTLMGAGYGTHLKCIVEGLTAVVRNKDLDVGNSNIVVKELRVNCNEKSGTHGILLQRCSNSRIEGNWVHDSNAAHGVVILTGTSVVVSRNRVWGVTEGLGHDCIRLDRAAAGEECHYCVISHNILSDYLDGIYASYTLNSLFLGNSCRNNRYHGLNLSLIVSSIVVGNQVRGGRDYGIYTRYSDHNSIVGNMVYAMTALDGIFIEGRYHNVVVGNRCKDNARYEIHIGTSAEDTLVMGNSVLGTHTAAVYDEGIRTVIRNNVGYPTENSGVATFSGDGVTTSFSWAHGLVTTPSKILVTPKSADASGDFYVTADATNITITYITAPPAGTDNVVIAWEAEV